MDNRVLYQKHNAIADKLGIPRSRPHVFETVEEAKKYGFIVMSSKYNGICPWSGDPICVGDQIIWKKDVGALLLTRGVAEECQRYISNPSPSATADVEQEAAVYHIDGMTITLVDEEQYIWRVKSGQKEYEVWDAGEDAEYGGGVHCSCPAGQHGKSCRHIAAVMSIKN